MLRRSVRPGLPETNTSSLSETPVLLHLKYGRSCTGLSVFVDAEEADVEIVARILEVVRVAAVERDLLLGSEDQADVGVLLVAIKMYSPPW